VRLFALHHELELELDINKWLHAEVHVVGLERSARQNRKSMTACCWIHQEKQFYKVSSKSLMLEHMEMQRGAPSFWCRGEDSRFNMHAVMKSAALHDRKGKCQATGSSCKANVVFIRQPSLQHHTYEECMQLIWKKWLVYCLF
jgi:hypothetical protein